MKLKFQNNVYNVSSSLQNGLLSGTYNNIDSKEVSNSNFQLHKIDTNHYRFVHNNTVKSLYVFSLKDKVYVQSEGRVYEIEKVANSKFGTAEDKNMSNKLELKSPMPGSIIKIEVELGQEVSEGDCLIVVEAMKMESKLYTSISGTVSAINVQVGQQIDSETVLIVVEKQN